jgi:type IV secretion system protein VirB11
MSADIHRLAAEIETKQTLRQLYPRVLSRCISCALQQWLTRDTVTEILVNRPGEMWIEDSTVAGMQKRSPLPEGMIGCSSVRPNRSPALPYQPEHPLLRYIARWGRVQFCGPPASRDH